MIGEGTGHQTAHCIIQHSNTLHTMNVLEGGQQTTSSDKYKGWKILTVLKKFRFLKFWGCETLGRISPQFAPKWLLQFTVVASWKTWQSLTSRLLMASCSSLTTSSPSTPSHLKPFVQVIRRPTASPSCLQGKEKVKPSGSFWPTRLCSCMKLAIHPAIWSKSWKKQGKRTKVQVQWKKSIERFTTPSSRHRPGGRRATEGKQQLLENDHNWTTLWNTLCYKCYIVNILTATALAVHAHRIPHTKLKLATNPLPARETTFCKPHTDLPPKAIHTPHTGDLPPMATCTPHTDLPPMATCTPHTDLPPMATCTPHTDLLPVTRWQWSITFISALRIHHNNDGFRVQRAQCNIQRVDTIPGKEFTAYFHPSF